MFSIGLVEHFENTEEIIGIHKKYISNEGTLLVIIPNFKGINGWVQKTFDKSNYDKHYIPCMERSVLHDAAEKNNFKEIKTYYYGKYSVWLEDVDNKSFLSKVIVKLMWFAGKVFFKLFPFDSKQFSPYIVLVAKC